MNPNHFTGSDSARIEQTVAAAKNGVVRIPKRIPDAAASRDWWLIDRAILLPADTTLVLEDCTLQLSDRARDNFIRSANCGLGVDPVEPLSNIHIRGEGRAVLRGAE